MESPDYKHYPINNSFYKHYKGGTYEMLFMSKHTTTGEDLVNYKSVNFGSYHSRPLKEWFDEVESLISPGQKTKRFELIIKQ